jgi:hypothetical protein
MTAPNEAEVRTYRYLRLGMIAVLLMLAVSVLIEQAKTSPGCWQGSISAYYYTPAQAVFVGALIAIGVCMVVLKGTPGLEDVLLNIGGMFAPVVALVPTPGQGTCWSVRPTQSDPAPNIANNLWGLFVAGGLALLISVYLGITAEPGTWDRRHTRALVASILIYLVGIIWFNGYRDHFQANAHYTAAVLLFVVIIAVVVLNARASKTWASGPYAWIAGLMAIGLVVGFVGWQAEWRHALLFVEAALIALFLAFWIIQTKELWRRGLRDPQPSAPDETKAGRA